MTGEERLLSDERKTGGQSNLGEAGVPLLSLGELTDAAGVSVRTIRYYIAEGLLPPPRGAGPTSAYSSGHLDRLRLIQRMKAAYFPLKEIRRRLAGLGDDEVRALLAAAETSPEDVVATGTADASLAGAREYLALLESRATYRAEPLTLPFVTPPIAAQPATQQQGKDFHVDAEWSPDDAAESPASPVRVAHEAAPPPEPALWRRLPLGDEAELVISDRAYSRHRERIDWLVRWARKVFA